MKLPLIIGTAATVLSLFAVRAGAQAVVDLGSAAPFAVLAGSGITITGPTSITGDIGSFPTATITGLGNAALTGTNHGGDATTEAAKAALLTAFNDAAGRTPTITYGAIYELGGQTLPAGVYNGPSSFSINGTLTLDGLDNPGSVWIFQAGSTLTTTGLATGDGSQIQLINGAQATNVFWVVGSSATLAGPSGFVGTVLAQTSITLTNGAIIDGRVLALGGAVTLDTNSISLPVGTAIPEPATTTLLVAGLLGAGAVLRKVLSW